MNNSWPERKDVHSNASVRAMTVADLPYVMEIERRSYDFPWSLGIFQDCLRVGYCCRVIELNKRVHGYGLLTIAAGEAHILNICIRPEVRRFGLGRALLQHLLDVAQEGNAEMIFLEVRPSNQAAIQLYMDFGFNEIGIRKDYYPAVQGREDALVFALHLQP